MDLISGHVDDPLRQGPSNLVNAAREQERIERLDRAKETSGASKEGRRSQGANLDKTIPAAPMPASSVALIEIR
jgi:hypothetical protein